MPETGNTGGQKNQRGAEGIPRQMVLILSPRLGKARGLEGDLQEAVKIDDKQAILKILQQEMIL